MPLRDKCLALAVIRVKGTTSSETSVNRSAVVKTGGISATPSFMTIMLSAHTQTTASARIECRMGMGNQKRGGARAAGGRAKQTPAGGQ